MYSGGKKTDIDVKKYLYFNYYRDSNPARRDEYLYCVRANLSHEFIDGYMVFLDNQSHAEDIPLDPRVKFVTLGRRLEFQDVIDHAQHNLDTDSVVIIINLDIFLANGQHGAGLIRIFLLRGMRTRRWSVPGIISKAGHLVIRSTWKLKK